jgi:hypothetical protein
VIWRRYASAARGSIVSIFADILASGPCPSSSRRFDSARAGIVDQNGKLIGVHIKGGCTPLGTGSNSGVALAAIKTVSQIIH